jgi:hypothetical protein
LSVSRLQNALRAARQLAGTSSGSADLRKADEELRLAAEEMTLYLSHESAGWREVRELLSGLDDPPLGARVGGLLAPAVDDDAEPAVLDLLKTGPAAAGRRAAVAMLSKRPSLEVLLALLGAARDDPDAGVRLEALVEAHRRRESAPSENAKALIEEAVRQRSVSEPDPNVRELVGRLLPGGAPQPPPRPPRRPSPLRGPRPTAPPGAEPTPSDNPR